MNPYFCSHIFETIHNDSVESLIMYKSNEQKQEIYGLFSNMCSYNVSNKRMLLLVYCLRTAEKLCNYMLEVEKKYIDTPYDLAFKSILFCIQYFKGLL